MDFPPKQGFIVKSTELPEPMVEETGGCFFRSSYSEILLIASTHSQTANCNGELVFPGWKVVFSLQIFPLLNAWVSVYSLADSITPWKR